MTRLFSLRSRTALLLLVLLSGAVSAFSQSAVTEPVGFQGRLAKPDGTPVADGNYSITFSAYNALTGGTLLWQQVSAAVPVHNGVFAVKLDFTTGLQNGSAFATLFTNSVPYLEIKVGADAPLTPRQKFASHAYAYFANTVPNGSIGLSQLANGLLNFSNIGGTLGANQLAAGSVTGDKLASGTIGSANLSSALQDILGRFQIVPGSAGLSLAGSIGTYFSPVSVAVSGNVAYVVSQAMLTAQSNPDTIQTFDVSHPDTPAQIAAVTGDGQAQAMAASGSTLYIINANLGGGYSLTTYDASNPSSPVKKSSLGVDSSTRYITVSGSLAVLTGNSNTMQIISLSSPFAPVIASSVTITGPIFGVAIAGNFVYAVGVATNTLSCYDVTNPTAPALRGTTATGTNPYGAAASGSFVYVVNYTSNTLQIFDVSAPAAPSLRSQIATASNPQAVAVSGNIAYVTTNNSLQRFDVSNPSAPVLTGTIGASRNPSVPVIQGSLIFLTSKIDSTLQIFSATGTTNLQVVGNLKVTGSLLFNDGTTQATAALVPGSVAGGDLSGTYPNPTIAAGAVTAAKIAPGVIPTTLPPSGAAGGDLSGTYPNPTLATLASSLAKVSGGVLSSSGGIISATGAISASSLNLGSYGLDQRFGGIAAAGFTVDKNGAYTGTLGSGGLLLLGSYGLDGIASNHNNEDMDFYTGATKKMTLTAGGYLGIGTAAPAFRVELPNTNNNDGKGRANAWVTYSSGRWKNHVAPIENPLEKVLNMRGVMFDWLPEYGGGHDIGFVAEEAGAVIPELAVWEKDGKFAQGLKYDRVSALLVEAVKALNAKLDDKQKQMDAQKREIEELKRQNAEIAELKKHLAELLTALKPKQTAPDAGK